MRSRNDFDRRFNNMRRLFWVIFVTAAILIFGGYILVGVIGIKVAKDPTKTFEKAGELTREWKEAFDKGYQVVASDDTLNVDSLIIK